MKQPVSVKAQLLPLFSVAFILLLLSSCGGRTGQQGQQEQLKEAKASVEKNINEMKTRINERIEYIDGRLEEVEGQTEEALEEYRAELKEQMMLLEKEQEKVKKASLETWENVINEVRSVVYAANKKTNDISLAVREMLED